MYANIDDVIAEYVILANIPVQGQRQAGHRPVYLFSQIQSAVTRSNKRLIKGRGLQIIDFYSRIFVNICNIVKMP